MVLVNFDTVLYNISAFIAGLFLLAYGADAFIDHTAILSARLGIPSVLIALLSAGAEWEELAVVIAALIQHRPSLALGNVIGSSISNILGAFSIGLLVQAGVTTFDRSSKIYTGILFVVTTVVCALGLFRLLGKVAGGILIGSFVIYIGLICWSIYRGLYRGVLATPENSDSGSEIDTDSDHDGEASVQDSAVSVNAEELDESSPLLPGLNMPQRSIFYHVAKLFVGFLALSLSGYILSHSSSTLASAFGLSETVFGATLLSIATTLPEKFVAVMSGSRGESGIFVANTVGSNIFLLTLCLGIVLLGATEAVDLRVVEITWTWASSLVLVVVVLFGSRRWMGAGMLIAYIVFLVLEFTLFRN
jgi:Ca2+/Na+ antiporter